MRGLLLGICVLAACGTDGAPTNGQLGWHSLVTKEWTLAPGEERTSDLQIISLDRDMVVGGIRPIAPLGTHHTLLARGESVTTGNIIYASGVGTNELVFPTGKGLRLAQDSFVGLQLHVFNTSDAPLSGTSGIEILEVTPDQVDEDVDLFLPGPRDFSIPPQQTATASGTCTVTAPQTVFALFPHMHQLGTHIKTTLTTGGTERVLHDGAYNFKEQAFDSFDPIALAPGDTIKSECTWANTTAQPVTYGESSTTEMCYSILFRYPAQPNEFCTH